jgi:uncharacterized membrane protein YeiH
MALEKETITLATLLADLIGVFVGAWMGATEGARRGLDLVGFFTVGLVSGVGGGVLRDILLQQGPPLALVRPIYLAAALAGSIVAFVVAAEEGLRQHAIWALDALALGMFAVAGAHRTIEVGLGPGSALLIAVVTAVGGGVLRDLLLGRIPPKLLLPGPFNAVAAIGAGAVSLMGDHLEFRPGTSLLLGAAVGFAMQLISRWLGVRVPSSPRRHRL